MKKNAIKIGRRDIVLSYIRYVLTTVSSLIILPFILYKVSSQEYAIWSVFLSLSAFVTLFDGGFGTVVTRYVTYAYCGARNISNTGVPETGETAGTNFPLLFDILIAAKRVYKLVSFIALLLLLTFGFYIRHLSVGLENSMQIMFAWLVFLTGVLMKMYYTYLSCFIKGIGKIAQIEIIHISAIAVFIFFKIYLTFSGFGLLGLSIANLVDIVITRLLIYICLHPFFRNNKKEYQCAKKRSREKIKSTEEAIFKNSKQMGLISIADYLSGQGKILLCATFLPLDVAAMFSLTNQLISASSSLAMIPNSTYRAKLAEAIVLNNNDEKKNIYSFIFISEICILIVAIAGIATVGKPLLDIIKSNTPLLTAQYILLIGLLQLSLDITKISTNYISLHNQQPFIRSYVISCFSGIALSFFSLKLGFGVAGFILTLLIPQLVYNTWKWPLKAYTDLNISPKEMFLRCIKYAYKQVFAKS